MCYASQRFGEGGLQARYARGHLDYIHSGNGHVVRERTRRSGNTHFLAELTLMGIAARAVLAGWLPALAKAVQHLVHNDHLAWRKSSGLFSGGLHAPAEFMSQDHRMLG